MSGRFPRISRRSAEKLRAITRELLDLAGERDVELLAEIGDLGLLCLDLGLGNVERRGDGRKLLAQGGDLRVQLVDLGASLLSDFSFASA